MVLSSCVVNIGLGFLKFSCMMFDWCFVFVLFSFFRIVLSCIGVVIWCMWNFVLICVMMCDIFI